MLYKLIAIQKSDSTQKFLPEHQLLIDETNRVSSDPFLSSDYHPRPNTVIIGIPTHLSGDYIKPSLENLLSEITLLKSSPEVKIEEVRIVVCLNGEANADRCKAEAAIRQFQQTYNNRFSVELIITDIAGKNNAMNEIIDQARHQQFELIHFIDDDIKFKPGSLVKNIVALQQNKDGEPLLTGSHFLPFARDLDYFKQQTGSVADACQAKFFHSIFSFPFEYEHTLNFASGQSLAGFVSQMPKLPSDASGITDDAFISYYFTVHGVSNQNHSSLIKPADSIVYFDVTSQPEEWLRQQIRVLAGLRRAQDSFGKDNAIINEYIHFPTVKPFPFKFEALSELDQKRLKWLRIFQSYNAKKTFRKLEKAEPVRWGTAASTKPQTIP